MTNNNFGRVLHKLRTDRNLSQSELSRRSVDNYGNRISVPYISTIESGQRKITSFNYLHLLANGLGISFSELYRVGGFKLTKSQRYLKATGYRLQQIMSARHLNRTQLAHRSFCHIASIQSWLNGNAKMSPYVLSRLCYVLKVEPRKISPEQSKVADKILNYPYFLYGLRLFRLRVQAKLTEDQLTKALNISQNQISLMELGKISVPLPILLKLSKIFKIHLSYLKASKYSLNDIMHVYSRGSDRMRLIRQLRGLTSRSVCLLAKNEGYALNSSTLSKAEHGKREFSLMNLFILSRIYGIKLRYLLYINNFCIIKKQMNHRQLPGFNKRMI